MSKIVLTTDDSVMSNYNNNIYLGFLSCLPTNICPLPLYRLIVPRLDNNPDGTVMEPPLPIRAVEAICVNSGIPREDVKIAQYSELDRFIGPETKIVGVSTHDPMGYGPATSTWSTIFEGKPHNRVFFAKMINKINGLKSKYGFNLVVGGSGYWQLATGDKLDRFGIDYLVEGEGEISVPKLFHSLLNNGSYPERVVRDRFPEEDEIPKLLGPTNCHLVEITRGCGRGCKFCAPTTSGKLRSLPLEKITHDVKLHADIGSKRITFQSDDCLRYGSNSLEADKDSLMNLFDECFATGAKELFITHASLVTFADQPEVIEAVTKKLESHGTKFYGCQPGLETGSYRLIDRYMKGKALPRDPEEWGKTVIEAMKVMKKNKWYPVCTLISGLPEEEPEDIKMTIDLIKKLESYPALYIPLFFVPMAMTSMRDREAFIANEMTRAHWDLMLTCWDHNLKYIYDMYLLVSQYDHNPFLKFTMKSLTNLLKMGMKLRREDLLKGKGAFGK
jgi:radical SAM superfamily enzyme YgiQ (UPF0313 family)